MRRACFDIRKWRVLPHFHSDGNIESTKQSWREGLFEKDGKWSRKRKV